MKRSQGSTHSQCEIGSTHHNSHHESGPPRRDTTSPPATRGTSGRDTGHPPPPSYADNRFDRQTLPWPHSGQPAPATKPTSEYPHAGHAPRWRRSAPSNIENAIQTETPSAAADAVQAPMVAPNDHSASRKTRDTVNGTPGVLQSLSAVASGYTVEAQSIAAPRSIPRCSSAARPPFYRNHRSAPQAMFPIPPISKAQNVMVRSAWCGTSARWSTTFDSIFQANWRFRS